jgi:hypothetical protein
VIGRIVVRHGYWIAVGTLSAAIALMLGLMAINIAVPELERAGLFAATSTPAPSVEPTASPEASTEMTMSGAVIPGSAQCAGCHVTGTGTIGLSAIPVMGHPLEGWSKCADCHAPARLVDTAPGHSGIHASQCTVCHKPGNLPAPLSRPHRDNQNVACLSCHGSKAPLPSDMTHRKEAVCWLCHRLPTIEPPVPAHATAPGEADCLTCHVAGGKAGKLPSDHVERPASLCLSCHEVTLGTTPGSTPGIMIWPAPSTTP